MVLDTEGFTDITIKYMGGVWVLISFQSIMAKENLLSHVGAGSWFSSIQQASDSFHTDERVAWIDIEGVPIMAWSTNTFTKITSKWGDLLYEDDKEDSENIFESSKIIVKGKVYWTRVKEVTGWSPDFMKEEDTQTESDNATIQSESDEEIIPEIVFENVKDSLNEVQSQNKESIKAQSEDPFNIYDILNKKHENVIVGDRSQTVDTLKYPPGENTKSQEDVVSNKANHKPKEDGESYGTVVDVYIPNRRSKARKRFAFVWFIKVDNVDRLVENLSIKEELHPLENVPVSKKCSTASQKSLPINLQNFLKNSKVYPSGPEDLLSPQFQTAARISS
nr:hypothetical protein [Tanacetum cinerariifolium]